VFSNIVDEPSMQDVADRFKAHGYFRGFGETIQIVIDRQLYGCKPFLDADNDYRLDYK
jgi:hypothetical protein